MLSNTTNGTATLVRQLPTAEWNGLGITMDGTRAYMVKTADGTVLEYDVLADSFITHTTANFPSTVTQFRAGAVNPQDGLFYAAASTTTTGQWALFKFNGTGVMQRVATVIDVGTGNNGDFAFDDAGNLYFLTAGTVNRIYRLEAEDVLAGTGASSMVSGTLISGDIARPAGVGDYAGMAFVNGRMIGQIGLGGSPIPTNTAYGVIQPSFGTLIAAEQFTTRNGYDIASCQVPYTISLQKEFPNGRATATDQFSLTITTPDGELTGNSVDTAGSAEGLQTQMVGPLLALPEATFSIQETALGATDLEAYDSSWRCENASDGNAIVAQGDGASGSFTIPLAQNGQHIVCTITNDRKPMIRVQKNLPSGRALPGDQFTLSMTGADAPANVTTTGSGSVATGVLSHLTATAGAPYTLAEAAAGTTDLTQYTSAYACSNDRAGGQAPSGTGTSFAITPVAGDDLTCTFSNVAKPRLTFNKSAMPSAGTAVQPGQSLSYTLTVNVANGPTQSPVVLTDVLGAGLTFGAVTAPGSFSYDAATGSFSLPAGQLTGSYSVSYSATVDADASDSVGNSVTAVGGGNPSDPNRTEPVCAAEPCGTVHPLQLVLNMSKRASPEAGTALTPGQSVTYTLTVDVANGPTQSPIVLTDVMGSGLTFDAISAAGNYTHDASANTFSLPAGIANGSYSVSYTAKVGADARVSVDNRITGAGGGNPDNPGAVTPVCAPEACEASHPVTLLPPKPVPLGSFMWLLALGAGVGLISWRKKGAIGG